MSSWFHSFAPNPAAKLRLFCFPFGGGGPSVFRDWHELLPDTVEVVCASLPGREIRYNEPLVSDVDVICQHMIDELGRYVDKPFVFFGHSLGGLIGHVLTSQLASEGMRTPEHLVVSGRSAPSDRELYYDRITHLPDDQFLAKLPEYGGTPESLLNLEDLLILYLPILRADFLMSEINQKAKTKLTCPISVFGGMKDRMSREKLQLWEAETTGSSEVTMFPGNHFFLNENQAEVITEVTRIAQNVISRER